MITLRVLQNLLVFFKEQTERQFLSINIEVIKLLYYSSVVKTHLVICVALTHFQSN